MLLCHVSFTSVLQRVQLEVVFILEIFEILDGLIRHLRRRLVVKLKEPEGT